MRIFFILLLSIVSSVVVCSLYIPQQVIISESIDKNSTSFTFSDSINPSVLQVEQIKTIPNKIHVGEEFSINATVKNAKKNFIISSSRGIIFASNGEDFAEVARKETEKLNNQILESL